MKPEQIIVLAILFLLSFFGYSFFERRLGQKFLWMKHNLLVLIFGIIGATIFTPFSYPYNMESFLRNLPVFTIIPLSALNIFYIFHDVVVYKHTRNVIKEIVDVLAILLGSFLGMVLINIFNIGSITPGDMEGLFFIVFLFSLVRTLLHYSIFENILNKKNTELERIRLQEMQTKTQLDILNSRINPHFLYNSLNSIAGLATVDGEKTQEMTIALSKLLRSSLKDPDNNFITLEEERELLEAYFDIEKIRFDEKLQYEFSFAEDAKKCLVPRFLLQPLVENCIKHAFDTSENVNFIKISASLESDELIIVIHDNGRPFPEKLQTGQGLRSVADRLQLLFPGRHELLITNTPLKQITIKIKDLKKKDGRQQ